MCRVFNVTDIAPFDLMRWGKDATYDVFSEEYNKRFNTNIEILEAQLSFIKNGIKVSIITSRKI